MKLFTRTLLTFALFLCFACPQDDVEEIPPAATIADITIEVVFFQYTPDTGNNTSKLEYEIIFTNPNNIDIQGFSKITTNADGVIASTIATSNSQCYTIAANSSCTYTFVGENSHDIGLINSVELVSVEYLLSE